MSLKFKKILCGILLSLFACATCSATHPSGAGTPPPHITYSTILDNMDGFIVEGLGEDDGVVANVAEVAQARWAEKIVDMMRANLLTRHWLDDEPADLELINQIFDESLDETKGEYPSLREQLDNPAVRRAVSSALGL